MLQDHLSDAQYAALIDINDGTEYRDETRVIDGQERR